MWRKVNKFIGKPWKVNGRYCQTTGSKLLNLFGVKRRTNMAISDVALDYAIIVIQL